MTTREQRIESVGESYEPAPAPRYSDRELSRQLAVATRALGRVQLERNRLEEKLVKLEADLAAWERTYPDLNDKHDVHPRGHFHSDCPGCVAEYALLVTAEKVST